MGVGRGSGYFAQTARHVTVAQVVICLLLVGLMVFANLYFRRDAVAGRSFPEMGRRYYEDVYYDRFLAGRVASEEIFSDYVEDGFPAISLTRMLVEDGRSLAGSVFEGCDGRKSRVVITPVAPWGRRDYSIETVLDCDFGL